MMGTRTSSTPFAVDAMSGGGRSPALSTPPSPSNSRRISNLPRRHKPFLLGSSSDLTQRNMEQKPLDTDEQTPLLGGGQSRARLDGGLTPKPRLSRHHSATGSLRSMRHHARSKSWSQRLTSALTSGFEDRVSTSKQNDERVWYDQFTSTDWVRDNIADAYRLKTLRARKDFRGRLQAFFDGSQGWILSALVGCITACLAFVIDISEAPLYDFKEGFCSTSWYLSERQCCPGGGRCKDWKSWVEILKVPDVDEAWTEFFIYVCLVVTFATAAGLLTLTTKTTVHSTYRLSTLDENLGADDLQQPGPQEDGPTSPKTTSAEAPVVGPMTYYSASGSGVAECKVILSGFVLHGFLGLKTLSVKTVALILSVASGLSIGKEGPFVHIAACVGNICCRLFAKYDHNDAKRREVLSAAAACGVAVAFGAPIGGVLFSLEEASYYFPAKTLFRTFFSCISAALSLKFLNPYGTNKIVLFEVRYSQDWEFFEMVPFIVVGMMGGAAGAMFIKASRIWARSFRRIPTVKKWPLMEVMLVALLTGLVSYWNAFTKPPVSKLLFNLASPCDLTRADEMGLCPRSITEIKGVIEQLVIGFIIKGVLTIITFGIKVPGGIYVPSMVVGGLFGRIVGHLVQWTVMRFPNAAIFGNCAYHASGTSCVTPGVYGLIAAGATMCGVTRLSVTLAVILFELTGSLDYVLPFSLSILVAKWTADAIEPLSIYDLLTNMNEYPYLNNKNKPVFTSDLADITPRIRTDRIIDISASPLVPAVSLRRKLQRLHASGEVDGGLPIVRDDVLVGLIPAPDLEFALDSLIDEGQSLCLMTAVRSLDEDDDLPADPTDFTPYIDPAPLALDIRSSVDLVYECFAKLGLRYICVLRDGEYAGLLHRKVFVKYVREIEESEH